MTRCLVQSLGSPVDPTWVLSVSAHHSGKSVRVVLCRLVMSLPSARGTVAAVVTVDVSVTRASLGPTVVVLWTPALASRLER